MASVRSAWQPHAMRRLFSTWAIALLLSSPAAQAKDVSRYLPPDAVDLIVILPSPFGTTVRTLVDAFQAFAAERAELLSASAADVVAIALRIRFPCQPGT
jgi:hypothetical protein